jgi:hypothetical protein
MTRSWCPFMLCEGRATTIAAPDLRSQLLPEQPHRWWGLVPSAACAYGDCVCKPGSATGCGTAASNDGC